MGVRPLLADRREPGGAAAGQQRRHAGLPLVREGERADDGLQPRQGRGRARAAPLRRRRPARRRRREPREHVLRGRTALLGDDERAPRPRARQRARVLRLLRRSLRVHPHGRTLPLGRAPRAAGRPPPAKARRGARRPRRPLPADPGLDHGRHARPQRRDAAGRHRRGRPGRLLDLRGVRRGRAPLGHRGARRLRGAQAARRPARAPGAGHRAGAASVSPGGAVGPRPGSGPAVSPALRRRARRAGARGAHRRRGLRAAGAGRGPELPRRRAHGRP